MQASKKIHACPYAGCTYAFNRPYRLAQHRLVHINIKPFACKEKNCSKSYTNKSHLDRHMNSVHKTKELDILYCCPICMKNYANRQNLKRHMKQNHSDSKSTYICDYCSAFFHKKQQIKAHIYQHTGVKAYRSLPAEDCINVVSRKLRENDMPIEYAELMKHCLTSGYMLWNSHFYKQVDGVAMGSPVSPVVADMFVEDFEETALHTSPVTPRFYKRCSLCLREYVTLSKRNKHMKNHKVYPCEHCDSKFNKWTDLMLHKKNNHQSPEFICNECGKVFKDRSNIIRHVKVHMAIPAVRVYFCPYENCQRQYSRNNNLKQHILVKHEGQTFECPLCWAQLSTKAKLNDHIARHTKPEVILKIPKTRENGRKKRKDINTMRTTSAMKLAGITNDIFKQIRDDNNLYYDLRET